MERIAALERLGLTKIEADVYASLLALGSTTTGPLIKKTELHRATVYDVLKRLMEKGLVNYVIKGKTKHFEATDAGHLLDIVEDEKKAIKKKERDTVKLVKELQLVQKSAESRQQAHVFVGKRAVKNIYELVLKHKEACIFGSHGRFKSILGSYFDSYRNRIKKKRIKAKLILSERVRGTYLDRPDIFYQIRFLPKEFDSPNATLIFGNYVATVTWTENPIGFLIESKEAADSFRNYFEIIWGIAKP